jgi:hypothetical protein
VELAVSLVKDFQPAGCMAENFANDIETALAGI